MKSATAKQTLKMIALAATSIGLLAGSGLNPAKVYASDRSAAGAAKTSSVDCVDEPYARFCERRISGPAADVTGILVGQVSRPDPGAKPSPVDPEPARADATDRGRLVGDARGNLLRVEVRTNRPRPDMAATQPPALVGIQRDRR